MKKREDNMILQRLTGLTQEDINIFIYGTGVFQTGENSVNTVRVPSQDEPIAAHAELVRGFNFEDDGQQLTFRFRNGDGGIPVYWLPWSADLGYHIDIPMNKPNANLFFTPLLSGCYLGIRPSPVENHIRVHHWNMQYPNQPSSDDLAQFADVKWVVPRGRNDLHGIHQFNYLATTFAWGERINNRWYFFFKQNGPREQEAARIITRISMNQAR
jgi:hypothetical protein